MKILVTGGAGYVGSVVTRHLLGEGYQVRVLDCLKQGGASLLGLYHNDNFEFVGGDIRTPELVDRALEGMDAIIHLAAIVGDPACARDTDLARQINQDASLQLFELSKQHNVRKFIFASTCSNYGKISDPTQLITEDEELRPVSLYAETKVAVEKALLAAAGNRPAVTILRFATIFGLSPRMRFDLTVNEFTMELVTKKKVTIYGEQFWRPYIHVRDAARAVAIALNDSRHRAGVRVFNVGDTQQNYQKGQLVELICKQLDHQVNVEHVEKQEDPRDYRVSFAKVSKDLNFHITRTVQDGIREIINVIREGVITDFDNPCYRN